MTQTTDNATQAALNFFIQNHTAYYETCFAMTQPGENGPQPAVSMGIFLGKNSAMSQSEMDEIDIQELAKGFGEWENAEAQRNLSAAGFVTK